MQPDPLVTTLDSRMPRKPQVLAITALGGFLDDGGLDGGMDMDLQASMEFTDGGSLSYHGFKINVGPTNACPLLSPAPHWTRLER